MLTLKKLSTGHWVKAEDRPGGLTLHITLDSIEEMLKTRIDGIEDNERISHFQIQDNGKITVVLEKQ